MSLHNDLKRRISISAITDQTPQTSFQHTNITLPSIANLTAAGELPNPSKKQKLPSVNSSDHTAQLPLPSPADILARLKETTDVNVDVVTLTRFMIQEQINQGKLTGETTDSQIISSDFTLLINSLQYAFKSIAYNIRKATLINFSTTITNKHKEKLDAICNDIFITAMKICKKVKIVVSEEQEDMIVFDIDNEEDTGEAKYAVVCDPIDGSSNIEAGISVGSIFGIYKLDPSEPSLINQILRPGKDLIAAGYTMYGASSNLVITTGNGLNGFTLDTSLGEFILTHPNIRIPPSRSIYSVNEGNSMYWPSHIKTFFDSLKYPTEPDALPYSARYIGSMVADVHRTILYGGLFAYPMLRNSRSKLRLLYEAFPMAMIIEQAGGRAIDDRCRRICDLIPQSIHETSGIWLGSVNEIERAEKILKTSL